MSDHDYDAFVARFMSEEAPRIIDDVQEQFTAWLRELRDLASQPQSRDALHRAVLRDFPIPPRTVEEVTAYVHVACLQVLDRIILLARPKVSDLRRQRN